MLWAWCFPTWILSRIEIKSLESNSAWALLQSTCPSTTSNPVLHLRIIVLDWRQWKYYAKALSGPAPLNHLGCTHRVFTAGHQLVKPKMISLTKWHCWKHVSRQRNFPHTVTFLGLCAYLERHTHGRLLKWALILVGQERTMDVFFSTMPYTIEGTSGGVSDRIDLKCMA